MSRVIRFTKAAAKPKKPKKTGGKKAALNKLNSFLKQTEPETVEILANNLHAQGNSVTYKELREAYMAGGMTEKQFKNWQKKYGNLVKTALLPKWEQAAALAAAEVKAKYPYYAYEPSVSAAMNYIKQHGAELVTNLALEQKDALNAVIRHVSGYTAITPDEAARIIRPCIGLTKPQALANARYRESVKQAYLKAHPNGKPETAEKKAREASARYAARQHRYRAQSIARTELAFGYNAGAYGATKDAQANGYIGECKKAWVTAYDERVCPICSAMDDEKKDMDEPFSNNVLFPPCHPQCRCAVAYEEIPGTSVQPQTAANANARQQPQPQQQAANPNIAQLPPTKTKSGYKVSEVLNDLSVLPNSQYGVAIQSDGIMLEGLNMSGRTVTIGGSDYYELSGKLTEETWKKVSMNAKLNGKSSQFEFLKRKRGGKYDFKNVAWSVDGDKLTDINQNTFEIYSEAPFYSSNNYYSFNGMFRVRIKATGNPAADRKALEDILDQAGLKELAKDTTAADELMVKKARIAWQRNPKEMKRITGLSPTAQEAKINQILNDAGITDSRVMSMEFTEVYPGYCTFVDYGAAAEYKAAGLTHVWSGIESSDSVVAILKSDGLAASNQRFTSGLAVPGASSIQDMKTGGASSVFTRLGARVDNRYCEANVAGDTYRFIFRPEVTERTDWYAFDSDKFGRCTPGSDFDIRASTNDFISNMRRHYSSNNEIMFRNGISNDDVIGISCQTQRLKDELLDKLRKEGITQIHGISIDKFCRVTTKIADDADLGLKGLSYYNNP